MDPTADAGPPESDGQVASIGEKRPAESEGSEGRPVKRIRGGTEEEMRRVAEIVLVLSAMAGMRGGGKSPTEAEMELMAEARAKLAEICEGFAPKDLVDRDAIWTVVEDLGLNWKAKDQRLGFRGSRLSIKEKFSLAKRKSLGPMHTIRTIATDKPTTAPLPSGGVTGSSAHQGHIPLAASPAGVTYKLQATVSPGLASGHLARDSSAAAFARVDKTQPKVDGGANGTMTYAPLVQGRVAPENKMLNHNATKVDGTSDLGSVPRPSSQATRDQAFRPVVNQSPSTSLSSMQNSTSLPGIHLPMQNVKFVHPSSFLNNHGEIAKIVQKLLQPKLPGRPTWTPPSRDYMSKAFTCQMCRLSVNEVETVVLCDSCEKGYHLKCLETVNQKGIPRGEWHCSKCTALSAGKPLPPKYGRVMRSMTTPVKGPSTIAGAQSSDKKIETADIKVIQEKMITDKSSSLKVATGSDSLGSNNLDFGLDQNTPKEKETSESISEGGLELGIAAGNLSSNSFDRPTQQSQVSESCKQEERSTSILHSHTELSDKVDKNEDLKPSHNKQDVVQSFASTCDDISSKIFQENSVVRDSKTLRQKNDNCEASLDTKKNEQEVVHANTLGKSEGNNGDRRHAGVTSDGLRNVEWIGNVLTVVDGKRYYESCYVDGSTYKLQDHALFHSSHAKLIPSKLQAMWEDINSGSKWVLVNRCYFPDDLPKAVGHPCAPESNEVYESNHGISVMAGLIQGPCEVLPSTKFKEKCERLSQPGIEANNGSSPVFLCKWFYDESKGNFQPVFS